MYDKTFFMNSQVLARWSLARRMCGNRFEIMHARFTLNLLERHALASESRSDSSRLHQL